MKKVIEFVKKYKIHILTSLLVIFFFRSCSKSGDVRKLEKVNIRTTKIVDSLTTVIKGQKDTINNISEVIRIEKIKIHTDYDNYISSKNRGEQLMDLINLIVRFLITHVHPYPGMPPVPVSQDGTKADDILKQILEAQQTILNQNIKLN